MEFAQKLQLVTFLVPPVCAGVLIGGFLLFIYIYLQYHNKLYLAMALIGLFGFFFVGGETMILAVGSWQHNAVFARQFDRIEQLAGVFYLFALPYFISYLLELNKKWRKFNRILAYIGLFTAASITVLAFAYPASYISLTEPVSTALKIESDFGRGMQGALYQLRDILLGGLVFYSLICITIDLFWHKKFGSLIFALLGILIAVYAAADDIVFVYTRINLDPIPQIQFSRFSLGITLLTLFSMAGLTRLFVAGMKEAEKSSRIISMSEKKYRLIVEGTNDFIFSLDSRLYFINANNAVLKMLNMTMEKLKTLSFKDLLYEDPDDKGLTRKIINANLDNLLNQGKSFDYKVLLKPFTSDEPKEFRVRLERIHIEDENEIVGKATPVVEDILLDCFHSEMQKYIIGNYLITADEISARLVRNLNRYMHFRDVSYLRVCLREIIINAIEHGNLGITFEEKTDAMNKENYMEFILKRQQAPGCKDKKVTLEYSITPLKAVYKITDEGNGFDYKKQFAQIQNEVKEKMLPHGRGISMAVSVFDEIRYNNKGNQVMLVKLLNKTAS